MTTPANPFGQEERARAAPHPLTSQIGTQPRRGKRQQLSMKKQMAFSSFNAAQRACCHQYTAFFNGQINPQRLFYKREQL